MVSSAEEDERLFMACDDRVGSPRGYTDHTGVVRGFTVGIRSLAGG